MGLLSSQIPTKRLVPVCRQLATSYSAGIPILRSLELVGGDLKDPKSREVLADVHDDIKNGSTLSASVRRQAQYLPSFFVELLSSGELGGKLDVMLNDLADYYEDRLATRRMIIGKMIYPIFVLVIAWFLGSFALMLIARLWSKGFNLMAYLRFYAVFQVVALTVFAGLVVLCIVLARLGVFKWIWGWVSTYIWPLGPVTLRFGLARFFRSMSLLIGSGMSMPRCIEASAAVTVNPYLARDLLQAVPQVMDGATLVQAFAGSKFLTPQAREMLLVGEESGKLEEALRKVSEYHNQEAAHAVDVATRVAEVVMILGGALVVGYIYISFFMKYYGGMLDSLGV